MTIQFSSNQFTPNLCCHGAMKSAINQLNRHSRFLSVTRSQSVVIANQILSLLRLSSSPHTKLLHKNLTGSHHEQPMTDEGGYKGFNCIAICNLKCKYCDTLVQQMQQPVQYSYLIMQLFALILSRWLVMCNSDNAQFAA